MKIFKTKSSTISKNLFFNTYKIFMQRNTKKRVFIKFFTFYDDRFEFVENKL